MGVVIGCMQDPDPSIRAAAVQVLTDISDPGNHEAALGIYNIYLCRQNNLGI